MKVNFYLLASADRNNRMDVNVIDGSGVAQSCGTFDGTAGSTTEFTCPAGVVGNIIEARICSILTFIIPCTPGIMFTPNRPYIE